MKRYLHLPTNTYYKGPFSGFYVSEGLHTNLETGEKVLLKIPTYIVEMGSDWKYVSEKNSSNVTKQFDTINLSITPDPASAPSPNWKIKSLLVAGYSELFDTDFPQSFLILTSKQKDGFITTVERLSDKAVFSVGQSIKVSGYAALSKNGPDCSFYIREFLIYFNQIFVSVQNGEIFHLNKIQLP